MQAAWRAYGPSHGGPLVNRPQTLHAAVTTYPFDESRGRRASAGVLAGAVFEQREGAVDVGLESALDVG